MNDQLVGYLLDINLQGMMLVGMEAVKSGTLFQLKMMLPEKIAGKDHLLVEASSRWCKKNTRNDWYEIGFQILKIAREDLEIIREHFLPDSFV